MYTKSLLLVLTLFLISCSNYKPLSNEESIPFTVNFEHRQAWDTWVHGYVSSINGKNVSYVFKSYGHTIPVEPGVLKLKIVAEHNHKNGDNKCPCLRRFIVDFKATPGRSYELTGKTVNQSMHIWIQDTLNNAVASDIIVFNTSQDAGKIFIPVPIK